MSQGDQLMEIKARRAATANTAAVEAARAKTSNTGARDMSYEDYDNDVNYNPMLNSNSAEYVHNLDTSDMTEMNEDRWKLGGGLQTEGYEHRRAGRDADGTIDLVKDPTKELMPILYALKKNCESYNIKLTDVFMEAGGSSYGTISTTRFQSALVFALHRMNLSEETLAALAAHYGCGDKALPGSAKARIMTHDSASWRDLCEDVENAVEVGEPYPFAYGGPPDL